MQKHTEINPMIKQIRRLQSPIKGRRALSWLLFLSLIAICLLLPAYHSAYPQKTADFFESHPQLRSIMVDVFDQSEGKMHMRPESITPQNNTLTKFTANTPQWQIDRTITPTYLGVDKLWSPSHALDRAHQALANDCKACHTTPFAQVQDKDCKACHKNAADHVDQKIITVKALKETSCTSCHSEHNGPDSLSQQNKMYTSSNCATCHSNIKKSFAKTKTENVKDFAKQHPEFRYQLAASTKPNDLVRTRHTKQGLIEKTDLKFPHDVHLKEGGVKSPKGKVDMNCTSCHTPNPDGLHFAPVTMKDHCQSCHDLKFEPAVSNREVPHGSVDLVLSTLREFYSYVQVNIVPVDENPLTAPINLVRPGKSEPKVASFVKSNGDSRSRAGAADEIRCAIRHRAFLGRTPSRAIACEMSRPISRPRCLPRRPRSARHCSHPRTPPRILPHPESQAISPTPDTRPHPRATRTTPRRAGTRTTARAAQRRRLRGSQTLQSSPGSSRGTWCLYPAAGSRAQSQSRISFSRPWSRA